MTKVRLTAGLVLLVLIFSPSILFAQEEKEQDIWKPLRFFVGAWEGIGEGRPGVSKVQREYKFVLQGISYDQARRKFVFRQFHVEGFINQYVLDTLSEDGKTFAFVTEGIENIPAGWRAKEAYEIINDDEFTETFWLAAPEQDFELYITNHFKRKR
jgi:hypothetical protein